MRRLPDQTVNKVGTSYVKWLSETTFHWVVDVTKHGPSDIMASQAFLDASDCTQYTYSR
jgi:hypothetical protein